MTRLDMETLENRNFFWWIIYVIVTPSALILSFLLRPYIGQLFATLTFIALTIVPLCYMLYYRILMKRGRNQNKSI
jgi:glucan phosphoethanolaminetransferase (alkaline phosphatase superfamily)